jgi:acyl-CoA synthetase (AMP-forming)/AMP-acid ligase II
MSLNAWLRRRLGLRIGEPLLRFVRNRLGPNLRVLASGGAALDPELAWKLASLGWGVAVGYGLTETSPILTLNPPDGKKLEMYRTTDTRRRGTCRSFRRARRVGGRRGEAGEPDRRAR